MGRICLFVSVKNYNKVRNIKYKSLLIPILLTCIALNIHGQLKEKGLIKKEKIITYWNQDKNIIRSMGQYHTDGFADIGEKIGKWTFYYPNGKIREISHYFLGKLHGPFKAYY